MGSDRQWVPGPMSPFTLDRRDRNYANAKYICKTFHRKLITVVACITANRRQRRKTVPNGLRADLEGAGGWMGGWRGDKKKHHTGSRGSHPPGSLRNCCPEGGGKLYRHREERTCRCRALWLFRGDPTPLGLERRQGNYGVTPSQWSHSGLGSYRR